MTFTRRDFLRKLGLAASATFLGGGGRRARIAIVGGGFAGALLAKRLADYASVYLITPNKVFVTCPMSNAVIGGLRGMDFIRHAYRPHPRLTHILAIADHFDASRKLLFLKDGSTLKWDKLILAPGISFVSSGSGNFTHAWRGGSQTLSLRRRLGELPSGGVAAIITPPSPYRCPPAPYERASLMAWRLRQLGNEQAKVLILDANHSYTKQSLFEEGWRLLYPHTIERALLAQDEADSAYSIDGDTITTADGDKFNADLINIIPKQRAGRIALPLADSQGWCRVNPLTFESERAKDVHVLGDAINPGAMPKSAFAANSQAKALANFLRAWLENRPPPQPIFTNACYSLLAPNYGISVTASYRVAAGRIVAVSGTSGESRLAAPPGERRAEAEYAFSWYRAAIAETF